MRRLFAAILFNATPIIVTGIIFLFLAALLLPAVQAAREAARRMQCGNNVKQICLGLQNYHDTFLYLPYGARQRTTGSGDQLQVSWGSSWLVATLPFMECHPGFDKIYSQDIASPANDYISIAVRQPDRGRHYMFCPSSPLPEWQVLQGVRLKLPSYAGIMGATNEPGTEPNSLIDEKERIVGGPYGGWASGNGMLLLNECAKFDDCTDGTANTLIVGEVADWYYTDDGQRRNPALSVADAGNGFNNGAGWTAGTDLDLRVKKDGEGIPADRICNLITIHHPIGINNRLGKTEKAPNWGTQGIGRCGLNNPLLAAHPAGAMVGFLDGHVTLIGKHTSTLTLKRLANRADGGTIPDTLE